MSGVVLLLARSRCLSSVDTALAGVDHYYYTVRYDDEQGLKMMLGCL